VEERLIGVAIVDGSEKWLNAVYFFFDPEEEKRSPGTFNILNLINFSRKNNIPLLYLGYYIEEIRSMRYKKAFKPHELLINGKWQQTA
jgi:arginine-tRNA-protein transferase